MRILHVTLAAPVLVLLQLLLRLPQLVERRGCLRAGILRPVGCCLAHRVRRVLELARRVLQILALLFARQLLEPPRRFLDFLGELPLRVAAATAG